MAEENRTSSIREPKPNTNGGTRPADLREPDPPATDRAERRYYHPLQKDYATFLKTSEETGGEYTLIEVEVAPGGGNTPHYHKTYAEHFEVLEGVLEVTVGGETRALHPGEKAVAPRTRCTTSATPLASRPRSWSSCVPEARGSRRR
jgi:mannose-6-phosphate isomerase-like protein (cupin superfamily)